MTTATRRTTMRDSTGAKGRTALVGRKLEARHAKIKHKPGSVRHCFAVGFRKLTEKHEASALADILGVGEDMIRKYWRGDRIPPVDSWDDIAVKLGKKTWRDLLA